MGLFDIASDLAAHGLPDVDVRKLRAVVELVWEHRDEIVRLATDLPGLLGEAGEQMQVAGDGAQQAGQLLAGDLRQLTASAADTLSATQGQVATVATVLGEIGKAIDRVPLVGNVAKPVSQGLRAIRDVSDDLDSIADQLRGISAGLDRVGAGLDVMGSSLATSGAALTAVSGQARPLAEAAATTVDTARGVAPTAKAPSRKKPAAKKAATKKPATAKKAAPRRTTASKKAPPRHP